MKPYLNTRDYFYSQEEFTLVKDETTDMLITQPIPQNLEKYYQSESYISHSDKPKTLIDRIYLFVKNYSLKKKINLINRFVDKQGYLLDIGAGTGDFLLTAKQHNWRIDGVEPNQLARTNAKTKGIILKESMKDLSKNTYDIITLWHVLEHLPDLQEQITTINELLKTQGILIVAVPNYRSYDAKLYKEYWAAYDVPRHLWHFSKKSILQIFTPYGFDLLETKPMLFDSFYVSLLSEKYKTGKTNYLKAFINGCMSNIKGLRSKEYSSHIYILRKA
ncbi:class I SAM-dependent methyltransferase [Maribacter chungangensis]|uniref:Class I SAM-dependent methyltransferase n=1 Tax=Maribacter chungangensis TaxID=1069117 RepID=A0ABW3B9F3_9FLAO